MLGLQNIARLGSRFCGQQKGPLSSPGELLLLRVRQSVFVFSSVADLSMVNAVRCPNSFAVSSQVVRSCERTCLGILPVRFLMMVLFGF